MRPEKIAVLNFSGNVGKTTIAVNMLRPLFPDAKYFSIETINEGAEADGVNVEQYKGKRFGEMMDALMNEDSALVDVGASNVEAFLEAMLQYEGSHEEFDLFVVPVVKDKKAQADTVGTVEALKKLGIDSNRIRLVFNKLATDESVEEEFQQLIAFAESGQCVANVETVIYTNEFFDRIKGTGMSLGDVANDTTDYVQVRKTAQTPDARSNAIFMTQLQRLARSVQRNFNTAAAALFA